MVALCTHAAMLATQTLEKSQFQFFFFFTMCKTVCIINTTPFGLGYDNIAWTWAWAGCCTLSVSCYLCARQGRVTLSVRHIVSRKLRVMFITQFYTCPIFELKPWLEVMISNLEQFKNQMWKIVCNSLCDCQLIAISCNIIHKAVGGVNSKWDRNKENGLCGCNPWVSVSC